MDDTRLAADIVEHIVVVLQPCRDHRRVQVLASLHFVVFAILMLPKAAAVMAAAGSS